METLYQYTSIDALAMILKKKEIKFSNLCLMDDPLEQFVKMYDYDTKDHHLRYIRKNYGKYCFVSCWTDEEKESIAMWDMYGDRKQGVRISMPQDMFDENFDINADKKRTRGLFDIKQEIVQPQLIKVDYDRLDTPEIVTRDWKIEIGNLGKYKKKDWEFQKECRFRLYAVKDKNKKIYWFIPQEDKKLEQMILQNPCTNKYVYFPLKKGAIDEMRIMIGPSMEDAKKELLNALIKKYGISEKRVIESSLYKEEKRNRR